MKAGERYFMPVVDLMTARDRLQRIIDDVEKHAMVPSIELMSASMSSIADAMIKTHRERLSDPRYKIAPGCQGKCGCEATNLLCDDCLRHEREHF